MTTNRTIDVRANGGRADVVAAVPVMAAGGFLSAQSAATGTNWTTFAAQECRQLTIANNSGTAIELRQDGAGVAFPIPDKTLFTLYGLQNANQIAVRRVDTSNTQVTIPARWEA